MNNDVHLKKALELDEALVDLVRPIHVLKHLEWPSIAEERFLTSWRKGAAALPDVRTNAVDYGREIEALETLQTRCDREHPLGRLVLKTARSYSAAARMLGAIGTAEFTRHSIDLYGRPDDAYRAQDLTGVDAAEFFLSVTDDLLGDSVVPPVTADIPAEAFAARLRPEITAFFEEVEVTVVVDPSLASKAVAGSKSVRLRAGALFSDLDLAQLLQHEAFIHAATMLNGKKQAHVRCLALGAPRTTRTQEGLAVFAELVTLSIDITRLRRLALRIRALAGALVGADFIEAFCIFIDAGQSETESFQSAARIFRGGDVRGKVAFSKDCVYLKGLIEVHTFLRVAIRENRPELVERLFAGRRTLGDAVNLDPLFDSGLLTRPVYVPVWARDLRKLASLMAYFTFASRVDLSNVTPENFQTYEDDNSSTNK